MLYHNGQDFSTYDHDVDAVADFNCASLNHGGWWYNKCVQANLNGEYVKPPGNYSTINHGFGGFIYGMWQGLHTLKSSKIMFRKTV